MYLRSTAGNAPAQSLQQCYAGAGRSEPYTRRSSILYRRYRRLPQFRINKADEEIISYPVKPVSIDSVVKTNQLKQSLIKIDAEVAEPDVLHGGLETYKTYKPILIPGLHSDFVKKKDDSMEQIWGVIQTAGYQVKMDGIEIGKEKFCSHGELSEVHCI